MNFSQWAGVVLGRWKTVLAVTLLLGCSVLGISLLMPKKYTATAAVLVDTRGVDALGGTTERSPNATQPMMATQIDLIGSERVARAVVARLNLEADPSLREQWQTDTGGRGDLRSHLARLQLRQLEVKPNNRDSNVINISFTSGDPKRATAIVNAFAQASIDTSLELKVEPARQFAGWFDERTRTLRKDLEDAQERLTSYQRRKGLVSGGAGQIDIENAKLAQLAAQLVQIQAARSESNSRQVQARGDARTSPDVLNNTVIAGLRASINTAETSLKQLNAQYGDRHPLVQSTREQLASLKASLETEMQAVARSVTTTDTVNVQREAETRAALEAQKGRVLALMNASNDMAILQRDVESAQRALGAATTRQSQTLLESQVQQTNVYLLTSATEPSTPSRPRVALNTATAGALGLLLGIALALAREARSPRVRNADDLWDVVELPLLATLPHASMRRATGSPRRPALRTMPG